jgi:8-oxo-dGTP diphosphatase
MSTSEVRWQGWPRAAASIAVFRGRHVLLVERGKGPRRGIWSLPGGHIEPGETARAAALRELDEETGVGAELGGLLDVHDVIYKNAQGALTVHYVLCVFWGHWRSGEPRAGGDSADARFVPVGDIESWPLTPGGADLVRRAAQLAGA